MFIISSIYQFISFLGLNTWAKISVIVRSGVDYNADNDLVPAVGVAID